MRIKQNFILGKCWLLEPHRQCSGGIKPDSCPSVGYDTSVKFEVILDIAYLALGID